MERLDRQDQNSALQFGRKAAEIPGNMVFARFGAGLLRDRDQGGGVDIMAAEGRMDCPNCKMQIPVHDGLRSWCDACGWNLGGEPPVEEENFLARQYVRLGGRYGKRTLESLKTQPAELLRPRLSLQTAAAGLLAFAVQLLSVAMLVLGIALVLIGYPDITPILLGAAACAFAWLMRPRPQPRPRKDVAERRDFPALFALVDEVTDALGGKRVEHIVIDETFNAGYSLAGWRRAPVLTIGLPLWMTLRPVERLAVLAHEAAHGVNGDSTRGFLIGSALHGLGEWIWIFQAPWYHAHTSFEALAGYVTWALSLPFVLYQSLLIQLLWLDKQRAEYFADYLASTLSGTDAMIAALRRVNSDVHLHDVLLKQAYSNTQSGRDILRRYRQHIDALPEREWRRLARVGEQENAQLDASHPPTAYRIDFLRSHRRDTPRIVVTDSRMSVIDEELERLHDKLGGRLIAQYAQD